MLDLETDGGHLVHAQNSTLLAGHPHDTPCYLPHYETAEHHYQISHVLGDFIHIQLAQSVYLPA